MRTRFLSRCVPPAVLSLLAVAAFASTPGVDDAPSRGRPGPSPVQPAAPEEAWLGLAPFEAQQKVALSRLAGVGTILVWGVAQWDYGDEAFHVESEGWFQQDTPEGGADKLGHLYTGYVLSRIFGSLYRDWEVPPDRAAGQAAVTSLLITATMELGDGFSPYGASWEDMVMNGVGAWVGYALMRSETWRERLDLRVEYRFNNDSDDPSTDYEHARYLVALKFAGFKPLRDTPLRWLELQGGYFARGYSDPLAPDRRTAYVGLGLNLVELARYGNLKRLATFLQFYQPYDSTLRLEHELD